MKAIAKSEEREPMLSELRSLGILGRAWIIGVLLFSAARALLAWPTFGHLGVNPWVFLAIDLTTAVPYGVGQAITVKVLRNPTRTAGEAAPWAILVAASFLAPYLYIFSGSKEMPTYVLLLVLAWMAVFGVLAVVRIRRQVTSNEEAIN